MRAICTWTPTASSSTAAGLPVLGDSGPISVPPFSSASVAPAGRFRSCRSGQTPQTISNVGRIKLVNPPAGTVARSADGLFRTSDGKPADADASTTVASGVLESSNVDLAGSMVDMIELSRNFDLQIKALHTAEDNAGLRQTSAVELTASSSRNTGNALWNPHFGPPKPASTHSRRR